MQKTLYDYCQEIGREELLREWDQDRNAPITPEQVAYGSHRMAWWVCQKGHRWQAMVKSRAAGTGCPVCTGKQVIPGENDLATLCPDIAKEWHPTLNGSTTPQKVTPYSNRKVWWLCPRGHPYQAIIATRTSHHSGCPYCAGRRALAGYNDLATLYPELAAQWHPTLNGNLTPAMVTPGSHKRVWWQCSEGHVWRAVIYPRTGKRQCGCPVCAGTAKTARALPGPEEMDRRSLR